MVRTPVGSRKYRKQTPSLCELLTVLWVIPFALGNSVVWDRLLNTPSPQFLYL
jgi:hypothetical protein